MRQLLREFERSKKVKAALSISQLFTLAGECAVAGDLEAKNVIMTRWIATHPAATRADLQRVYIHRCDWRRRQGRTSEALLALTRLGRPATVLVRVEYLQAYNQCLLRKARRIHSRAAKILLLQKAVRNQHTVARLADQSPLFPLDKRAYYWEGVVEHRLALLRAKGGGRDRRLEHALGNCEKSIGRKGVPLVYVQRGRGMIAYCRGQYLQLRGQQEESFGAFAEAWHNLGKDAATRYRCVIAICVLASFLLSGKRSVEGVVSQARRFIRQYGMASLMPSERQSLREQIRLVKSGFRLGS